jgi:hypothetical protein
LPRLASDVRRPLSELLVRVLVVALAPAALLAACGGGHQAKSSTSATATRSSTSAPATSSTATAPRAAPPSPNAYWPYKKVVASLAGRTLVLRREQMRVDPALVECNGQGATRRIGPTRGWNRYTCTQTRFQGGADHDVTFDVVILSATQLKITSERYGPS